MLLERLSRIFQRFDWRKRLNRLTAALRVVIGSLFFGLLVVMYLGGVYACFVLARKTFSASWDEIIDVEAAKAFFPTLIAVIGGPILIWRVATSHVQAQATRYQAETGREAHYTSLFTRAVEQLGATRDETDSEGKTITKANLEVRLGAIYAFERIAQDSERDHWPIMEVLSAHVRNHQNNGEPQSRPENIEAADALDDWLSRLPQVRVDVRAALTVIGRRGANRIEHERRRNFRLDFSKANLQRAMLNQGNFEAAFFDGAFLEGANLAENSFAGSSFHRAHLIGAQARRVGLEGAMLAEAHLDGADMAGAILFNANLDGATLIRTYLSKANLSGASLMNTDLTRARLDHALVEGSDFSMAKMDQTRVFAVDFTKSIDLSSEVLLSALGDTTTKLPSGVDPPKDWPDRALDFMEREKWARAGKIDV